MTRSLVGFIASGGAIAGRDLKIQYAVHSSTSKKWSVPKAIASSATSPKEALTLAPMARGRAIVGWRATNSHGFTAQYDAGKDTWSAPSEIDTGGAAELASVPVVAEGRCGNSDAIAAYVLAGGSVGLAEFKDGAAKGPYPIGGIANAVWVGVAEAP